MNDLIKNKRAFTVKEILDARLDFVEWIKGTKLYNIIVELTNTPYPEGTETVIQSDEINLNLVKGIVVNSPYDLPIELIYEFYANSPFYNIGVGMVVEEKFLPNIKE